MTSMLALKTRIKHNHIHTRKRHKEKTKRDIEFRAASSNSPSNPPFGHFEFQLCLLLA